MPKAITQFRCDVCQAATFTSFDEACRHEEQCTKQTQQQDEPHQEAMTVVEKPASRPSKTTATMAMGINSRFRKHSNVSIDGTTQSAKRPRHFQENNNNSDVLGNLPFECSLRILSYLSSDDLSEAAQVSRHFRQDCRHSSLDQTRTVTYTCRRTLIPVLLLKLLDMDRSHIFSRFHKLKIVGHGALAPIAYQHVKNRVGSSMIQDLNILDLSLPSTNSKKEKKLRVCVFKALAPLMPNLRQVDLSNALVSQTILTDFARFCPHLEKITWHGHQTSAYVKPVFPLGGFLSGMDLRFFKSLKEIIMDDSTFNCLGVENHAVMLFSESTPTSRCIFWLCNAKLEKVSLKNSKSYIFGNPPQAIPQLALLKFVRCTRTLRWFRSDLTPENVSVLKAERPDVTFAV
jgi:hypothetical protein